MSDKEIKVPNIGEFKDVEVIEVLVSVGEKVKKNEPLITIESDKSSVEIPSSFDGIVKSLNSKVGDKVSEGSTILVLEIEKKVIHDERIKEEEIINKTEKENRIIKNDKSINIKEKNTSSKIAASPKARKFARELGVNIGQILGSQRQGRVIESDIKKFVSSNIKKKTRLTKNKI